MCGATEPSTFDKSIVSVLASNFTLPSKESCVIASLTHFLYILLVLVQLEIYPVQLGILPLDAAQLQSPFVPPCVNSVSVWHDTNAAWGGFPTHRRRRPTTSWGHTLRHCRRRHHDGGTALRADKADP